MSQNPYIFTQLMSYIDRDYFEMLVSRHKGNFYVKRFTCWNQLMAMLWAQLTNRTSLRDIECSLRGHRDKIYRLGMGTNISRNTLANANAKRNVAIFRDLAQRMMEKASRISARIPELDEIRTMFRISGFFAADSTTVTFDLKRHPWSTPQSGKGGIKLHTLFDLLRQVPAVSLITGHEEKDQTFMDDYPISEGNVYIFDKAYVKCKSLYRIQRQDAWFVVRPKENMKYQVTSEYPTDDDNKVMGDKIIVFTSRWASRAYPIPLRLIEYYSPEKNEVLKFITNNLELPALLIALLYKHRWDIEEWHRWIKQHLRIVKFYGTSPNAIMIQVYVAVIAYCILALAADNHKFKDSLYEFSRLLSTALTEKKPMSDIIRLYENSYIPEEQSRLKEPSLFDCTI